MQIGKKYFDGPSNKSDTVKYSWAQIEQELSTITGRIKYSQDKLEVIIGLSRGGLIPGVILSHRLNVPFVALMWQTRDGTTKDRELLSKYNKSTTLIVDDLIDSGETFFQIKEAAPNVKYCAIFNKQPTIVLDYWGSTLYNENRWLDFPWEKQ